MAIEEAIDEIEAREKAEDELKSLRRKVALQTARPVKNEVDIRTSNVREGGISLTNGHLALLVALTVIAGFIWQFMGAPLTGMRDDLRDIKANYVKRDDLKDLARKSDLDAVKSEVDGHEKSITKFEQLKELRDGQVKQLQDGQAKQDAVVSTLTQQITRLEGKVR